MIKRSLTSDIIELAFSINFDNLPNKNKEVITRLLLDGFGVLFAGISHNNVELLINYFKNNSSQYNSKIPGKDFTISLADAAFINGTAIHVLDFEPMFIPPTHVVSPVLGALSALLLSDIHTNNLDENPDSRFLHAFIAGIQLQADLRIAAHFDDSSAFQKSRFFPFQKSGFHPPGIVGVMGSALACAIYLNLSKEHTSVALGMAASRAAGISDNIGSMTKATHSGNAARNGLECCLLSKAGFTASSKTFEAPGGWGEVFGGDNFYGEQLRLGMSHVSCFNNPGFAFKKWPAHTAMQIAINAALGIEQPINTLDIAIVIKTPIFNYCDRPFPKSGDECRFSFQFNVVKALLDKEITNESYTLDSLNDSNVQQLLGKTTLIMSPDIPATFHEMWVEIELSNGIKSYSENWPGHWKTSANDVQHVKKFTDSASKLFNSSKSLQLISCFDLESNNINLSQLKGILSK